MPRKPPALPAVVAEGVSEELDFPRRYGATAPEDGHARRRLGAQPH